MSNRTSDFPPLLPPGEHKKSVNDIYKLCVSGFPLSSTRAQIMEGFLRIVELLKKERIRCELVIDGSYLTEEIEPEDLDFVVVVTPKFYESCTPQQRKTLDWIGDDKTIRASHLCDCYLCVNYKKGDGLWFEGINDRAWWVSWYSKSVIFKRDRGVAVVKLGRRPNHESSASSAK